MGVLEDAATNCLLDCLQAARHVGDANELRFDRHSIDEEIYADPTFTVSVSAAERALRRARESLGELAGPSHSRVIRICTQACKSCEQVLELLNDRESASTVEAHAAKIERHCQRALA